MPESIIKTSIPKGGSISNALDCRTGTLVRIHTPPAWSQAPLTVQLSPDNNLWSTLTYFDGHDYEIAVVPNSVVLPHSAFTRSIGWLRLISGSRNKVPLIPQADNREFTLIMFT
jgi:hypothetical protein